MINFLSRIVILVATQVLYSSAFVPATFSCYNGRRYVVVCCGVLHVESFLTCVFRCNNPSATCPWDQSPSLQKQGWRRAATVNGDSPVTKHNSSTTEIDDTDQRMFDSQKKRPLPHNITIQQDPRSTSDSPHPLEEEAGVSTVKTARLDDDEDEEGPRC